MERHGGRQSDRSLPPLIAVKCSGQTVQWSRRDAPASPALARRNARCRRSREPSRRCCDIKVPSACSAQSSNPGMGRDFLRHRSGFSPDGVEFVRRARATIDHPIEPEAIDEHGELPREECLGRRHQEFSALGSSPRRHAALPPRWRRRSTPNRSGRTARLRAAGLVHIAAHEPEIDPFPEQTCMIFSGSTFGRHRHACRRLTDSEVGE